jgi:hypothetical protein
MKKFNEDHLCTDCGRALDWDANCTCKNLPRVGYEEWNKGGHIMCSCHKYVPKDHQCPCCKKCYRNKKDTETKVDDK